MADRYDDRNRQGKALDRWEQQQKMWARLTTNLAKKVGKADPSQTLPGSIHHFRLRQEESTLLDASVPPEVKSGHHAWEMNLRNYDTNATGRAGGGFRYVQFGVPHPYPLYVPVRDGVSTDPESNTLTRVIVGKVAPRHKPISESQYYHQRQTEYKKHIKRIFSHFSNEGQEGLVVVGRPPPTIDSKELADGTTEEAFAPVVFYPPPESKPQDARAPTPPPNENTPVREAPKSRPSIAPSEVSVAEERKKQVVGPALTISAASLVASVRPGELAQLTLCAANGGTTAIFYQWAPRERDPVPGLSDKAPVAFDMADVPTGVLLPGDQKLFTFSFRPLTAGSFSQTMDFNTVPAGKERILVHLQVFAISEDENPAATRAIEEKCAKKAIACDLRTALLAPIGDTLHNRYTVSDLRATVELLRAHNKAPEVAHAAMVAAERRQWAENNCLAKDRLPSAACPFREAQAHNAQSAKDGRSSASLAQPQLVTALAEASGAAPSPPATAKANPANEALFAAETLTIPYQESVYARLKGLFANLQSYKERCAAVRETAAMLEPRPPPQPAAAEGRPKSGGPGAAKAQQQLLQQQQLAEREMAREAAAAAALAAGEGLSTPRQPAGGRASVLSALMPHGAAQPTVSTASLHDPQLSRVYAQECALGRAVALFDGTADARPQRRQKEQREAPAPEVSHETPSKRAATPLRSSSPFGAASPALSPNAQGASGALTGPSATAADLRARAAALQWDGSVRMLLEEVSTVRDNEIRNSFLNCAQLLLRAAAAGDDGEHGDGEAGEEASPLTLQTLVGRLAVADSMGEALVAVDYYAQTAKSVCDARSVGRRTAADTKDKGKGAGAKKGAAAKGAAGTAGGRPPSADGRGATAGGIGGGPDDAVSRLPFIADAFFAGSGTIYEDAVAGQIKARRARYLALIASVCDQPVLVTHHRRMELVRQDLLAPHADVDTVVEPTKKKR